MAKYTNRKHKFYNTSVKAWQGMYEAIQSARISVYMEMYIFLDDIKEFDFVSLLIQKAKSGVQVKIILDAYGSMELNRKSIAQLKEAGIEVFFISYFWHRLHRKILIIDEQTAFFGGVNIHHSAKEWLDLMMEIRGKIVERFVRIFARDYVLAGGVDPVLVAHNKKVFLHKTRTFIVDHLPMIKKFRMKDLYKDHIALAKKEITLVTPYFVPKRWFVALLHQAVLRGVEVSVIIPENTEHVLLTKTNYFYMNRAQKLGIKFYLGNSMNHAKIMLIDSDEALIGSQNLDFLSFELNSEIGVFFKQRGVVTNLYNITSKWKSQSKPLIESKYRLNFFERIFAHILNVFVQIL